MKDEWLNEKDEWLNEKDEEQENEGGEGKE